MLTHDVKVSLGYVVVVFVLYSVPNEEAYNPLLFSFMIRDEYPNKRSNCNTPNDSLLKMMNKCNLSACHNLPDSFLKWSLSYTHSIERSATPMSIHAIKTLKPEWSHVTTPLQLLFFISNSQLPLYSHLPIVRSRLRTEQNRTEFVIRILLNLCSWYCVTSCSLVRSHMPILSQRKFKNKN